MASPRPRWQWTADGNVFFGYNHQQRQFLDDSAWESQNWFMGAGTRTVGRGELALQGMLSLEPFTLAAKGSPQLFQTGESYQRIPLINYQHPHDLVMGLGATYSLTAGRVRYAFGADLVGSPTLGPTAFMHRESARDNPQVPITHHFLDSTHISAGVVRAGAEIRGVTLEASAFRGEEPDEDRTNIERPRLDSWALRARYARGPWRAQFSGGRLHRPEWWEPYDESRLTASLSFDGSVAGRSLSATAAWGHTRHYNTFNNTSDGFLFEATLQPFARSSVYGRTEWAGKELLGVGPHGPGDVHPHFFYDVSASTVGYIRELANARYGRVGIGADAVFYTMPPVLAQFWAGSHSYHVFVRWRPAGHAHMHQH